MDCVWASSCDADSKNIFGFFREITFKFFKEVKFLEFHEKKWMVEKKWQLKNNIINYKLCLCFFVFAEKQCYFRILFIAKLTNYKEYMTVFWNFWWLLCQVYLVFIFSFFKSLMLLTFDIDTFGSSSILTNIKWSMNSYFIQWFKWFKPAKWTSFRKLFENGQLKLVYCFQWFWSEY